MAWTNPEHVFFPWGIWSGFCWSSALQLLSLHLAQIAWGYNWSVPPQGYVCLLGRKQEGRGQRPRTKLAFWKFSRKPSDFPVRCSELCHVSHPGYPTSPKSGSVECPVSAQIAGTCIFWKRFHLKDLTVIKLRCFSDLPPTCFLFRAVALPSHLYCTYCDFSDS